MDLKSFKQWVLEYFSSETIEGAEKQLFRDTACGAWLQVKDSVEHGPSLHMGSIIEGSIAETDVYTFSFVDNPNKNYEDFSQWVRQATKAIENEVDELIAIHDVENK
jgi:hypothetical protein